MPDMSSIQTRETSSPQPPLPSSPQPSPSLPQLSPSSPQLSPSSQQLSPSSPQPSPSSPQPPPSSEPLAVPTTTGGQSKFSYTKNWGEVSNTLRKKLSKRLSALKESDDNSGDEDRAYRSDRSQVDGARSPPDSLFSGRSDRVGSPHERSPDALLGADGLSSVRHSRAAIWQKISSASAVSVASSAADRSGARFNRVGTAFQGMYISPAARLEHPRADEDGEGGPPTRPGSGTPDREYRSLAAFITRSATPERVRARSNTPGGGRDRSYTPGGGRDRSNTPGGGRARSNTPGGGRVSRDETPERQGSAEVSPSTVTRGRLRKGEERQRSVQKPGEEVEVVNGSLYRNNIAEEHASDYDSQGNAGVTDGKNDRILPGESYGSGRNIVSGKKQVKQDDTPGSMHGDPDPEDLDEDDEDCLACKSESQLLSPEKPASEDMLSLPRSMHSNKTNNDRSPGISHENSPEDVRSNGSSTASRKKSSKSEDNKGDGDGRSTSRISRTVTHFVEVTSVEDGNKRITYVENGVTVEPVIVSKTKGTQGRKTRAKTPAPKVIKEEEDGRSLKSLHTNSESTQSLRSSKTKQRHSPSSPSAASVSDSVAPSMHSEASETGAPLSGAMTEESSVKKEWPLEPGPHTGAIPKRRDRYGTRVVKFPKDRSRGRREDSPSTEPTEHRQRSPSASNDRQRPINGFSEPVADNTGYDDAKEMRTGPADLGTVNGAEQRETRTAEAEIQRGSVARHQALYESISEVTAGRRIVDVPKSDPPPPPPARPAVMPPPPAPNAAAADTGASEGQTPAGSMASDELTSGGTSSVAGSDTNGGERNYRLRRSALEALPVHVPTVRELVSSRFKEPELTEDLEHGNAEDDSDSWISEPLDEERQEAESDGDSSNHSQGSVPSADDGKHSLLQYAMTHFRDADERYNVMRDDEGTHSKILESKNKKNKKKGKEDWTWREQVELVKWTEQPLRVSLLKLDSPEMARLAVDGFQAILRYMGDQAMPREVTDVDCVYTVLMACHRFPAVRDEVYCQLMRQTTSNRSSQADSCQRGWRLLSLVAAFFACSDSLQPYLMKYLETVAQDQRRGHHQAASVCLQNLRRTLRLGGRKNVPSEEEIAAVTAGCTARRQRYLLPGGTQRVVSTRCTTVVQDVVAELCRELTVTSEEEQEEYSLYCVVEGDAFTLPLPRHEYIIDVTTELQKNRQVFHLVLCRTVWFCPLRLDSPLYVEAAFSQAAPDYLEGLLLVMPAETLQQNVVFDIARVAALLHRAAGLRTMPTMKETKYLLPKAALLVRDIKPPQWVNMVQDSWTEVQDKTAAEARVAVLETLSHWPLFGSAFFVVGGAPGSRGDVAADQLLAINSRGLHLLDTVTHETRSRYPFSEVLSTRRVRSDAGDLFIDLKVGTPEQTKVVRLQSENAPEIARLIRQYSGLEQRCRPMAEHAAEPRERQVSR